MTGCGASGICIGAAFGCGQRASGVLRSNIIPLNIAPALV